MMLISIITPTFNSQKTIKRAMDSVLFQSYQEYEHIVIDNLSSDGTCDLVRSYPKTTLVTESDRGQSDALNKGLQYAKGDIIVLLNADDYFEENIFSMVVKEFKNSQVDLVLGNLELIYETGASRLVRPDFTFYKILAQHRSVFPYNPVSYFCSAELYRKIGPFPIDNHYTMDYWFLVRAYDLSKIVYVNKKFGVFVNSGDNKSSGGTSKFILFKISCQYLLEKKYYLLLFALILDYFSWEFIVMPIRRTFRFLLASLKKIVRAY